MVQSVAWKQFKKNADGSKVICDICKKDLRYRGSTSTMISRLENVHHVVFKKLPCQSVPQQHEEDADDVQPLETDSTTTNVPIPKPSATADEPRRPASRSFTDSSPLFKCFDRAASFTSGSRAKDCDDALLYMIAVDNLPLQAPEKKGFLRYSKTLQPLYKPPTEKTCTKRLGEKYNVLKKRVGDILREKRAITLTTDIWTETKTTRSFLDLTAHYLDGISIQSVMIGARHMRERKTAEILKENILDICREWEIKPENVVAIVTDHGANIVLAAKEAFGAAKHYSCIAHAINLVAQSAIGLYGTSPPEGNDVMDADSENDELQTSAEAYIPVELVNTIRKLKKIVGFFRRSEIASKELEDLQKRELNKTDNGCLRRVQEVCTRWNSLFEMIDRYILLSDLVDRALTKMTRESLSRSKPPAKFTDEETEVLRDVRDVLKPLWEATVILSAEQSVTISKVIPTIRTMQSKISAVSVADAIAFNLKAKILDEIDKRLRHQHKSRRYAAATMIDPRFKKIHFDPTVVADTIVFLGEKVKGKIAASRQIEDALALSSESRPTDESSSREPRSGDFWDEHHQIVATQRVLVDRDFSDGVPLELRQYLSRPVIAIDRNPFEEMETLKKFYPHVCEVAHDLLPICATSVPSERLFSRAGLIVSKQRNRLSGQHVNMLLFLQSVQESLWFEK